MKTAGIIMIILFSSSLGLMIDAYKKKQIVYIENLIYIAQRIRLLMNSINPETAQIMIELKSDERLKSFDFELHAENTPLPTSEYERIKNFFAVIGKYDSESQLNYIDEFIGYFKMLKQQYQEYYQKHHKLYITFGFAIGVIISIFLI